MGPGLAQLAEHLTVVGIKRDSYQNVAGSNPANRNYLIIIY